MVFFFGFGFGWKEYFAIFFGCCCSLYEQFLLIFRQSFTTLFLFFRLFSITLLPNKYYQEKKWRERERILRELSSNGFPGILDYCEGFFFVFVFWFADMFKEREKERERYIHSHNGCLPCFVSTFWFLHFIQYNFW